MLSSNRPFHNNIRITKFTQIWSQHWYFHSCVVIDSSCLIENFNFFLVTNLVKSLSSKIILSKFTIFWNSVFIEWHYILCSKQFKAINCLLSFCWWNVNLFYVLCFFFICLMKWFSSSIFFSNQICSHFCRFLNYSIRSSFCWIYFCFCCSMHQFLPHLPPNFLANDKKLYHLTYFLNFGSVEYLIFFKVCLIISAKLTLSSISSALLAWSVNQTSTKENSVLTVFIIVKECSEIFINCTNCLFGRKVNKPFDVCW